MNKKRTQTKGRICQLGLVALLTTGLSSQAQTPLQDGHTDVGIDYDEMLNEWNLHVHHEGTDTEYSPPTDAVLFVKYGAHSSLDTNPQWSFLGSPGADIWTLPKVQDLNLLFLGIGSEEIADGTFVGNQFTLTLSGVTGPGRFAVYDTDVFGNPVVWMNSGDGISGADARTLPSGTHSHINWAFTAPGDYSVFFNASAISVLNGATSSGSVEYRFHVEAVPEPGAMTLVGAGALTGWLVRRRRN